MDFYETTKKVWDTYFYGGEDGKYLELELFDPNCVIIGAGKHEFYENIDEFFNNVNNEILQRDNITFNYKDFWCETVMVHDNACLVYGGLFIWIESHSKQIEVNMDSRFTMLYKLCDDGWKIVHIHRSIPNFEQEEGEYYPKKLSQKLFEEKQRVDKLSLLAEKDGLTDLINFRTFQTIYDDIAKDDSWLFVIDIDDFKNVNDNHGHLEGNRILKETANVLKESVRIADVVCRMGGDEFIILCDDIADKRDVEVLLLRIIENLTQIRIGDNLYLSVSIGASRIKAGDSLSFVFNKADNALYNVKSKGKNNFCII